jgi:hypothetical protein
VPAIKASLLLNFAEQDPNINGRWPGLARIIHGKAAIEA